MTQEIDLTPTQAAVVHQVLRRVERRVHRVDVYGSRVQGCARPGSDIDLAVHTDDPHVVDLIADQLEESELSIFADVTLYSSAREKLRREIDRVAVTIFPSDLER